MLSYDDLEKKCRRQESNLQCALERVTFWAWCVYLFRHAGKVARVGFQPTVSWMKARHVGSALPTGDEDRCPRQELNL